METNDPESVRIAFTLAFTNVLRSTNEFLPSNNEVMYAEPTQSANDLHGTRVSNSKVNRSNVDRNFARSLVQSKTTANKLQYTNRQKVCHSVRDNLREDCDRT